MTPLSPTTDRPPLAIEARDLSKRFGSVHAVRGVSLSVPERTVCGLLGPNGAGKTTTIRMLAGLLVPDAGTLTIAGLNALADPESVRRRIGYLPESAPIHPELRTREFLRYRAELLGLRGRAAASAIESAVVACDLAPVWGRLVGALSKGYRQRVGVAAAILGDPALVILDEPSVGLDPTQLRAFRALLRALGSTRTVLLSSHILSEIEAVCDMAVLINHGRLVAAGSIDELRARGGSDRYVIEARLEAAAGLEEGADARIRTALGRCPSLGSIACEPLTSADEEASVGSWLRVTCESSDGGDHRDAIAGLLAEARCRVRELRRERPSLEGLFAETAGANR
jgi:ABC-2 type transport system ATP-binding protein